MSSRSSTALVFSPGVQVLRGLAALLIVLLHLGVSIERYGDPQGFAWFANFQFGRVGVDIFFVISGFVMMLVTENKQINAGQFLWNRFTRIYPNYWIYFGLIGLVILVQPSWVNSSMAGSPSWLQSFMLWPTLGPPVVAVAWTLEFEIYFYLLFSLLLWLIPERKIGVLFALFVVLVGLGALLKPSSIILERFSNPLLLEFAAGALMGRTILYSKRALAVYLIPVALLLFGCLASGLSITRLLGIDPHFARLIDHGLPSLFLVMGVVDMDKRSILKYPKWCIRLGDSSYTLYLSHVLVLAAIGRLYVALDLSSVLPNLALMLLLLVGCLIFAELAFTFIEKPLLRAIRNLRK